MSAITSKKVLLPLATAALAGALAVGSGASWTTSTGNTANTVTSGKMQQTNSKDGKSILSLTNMKPGDSVSGQVTITNVGTLKQTFSMTETDSSDFSAGVLREKIEDITTTPATTLYDGALGTVPTPLALGEWAAGEAHTYRVTVTFDKDATGDQGKSASASFTWDGVQGAGVATDLG